MNRVTRYVAVARSWGICKTRIDVFASVRSVEGDVGAPGETGEGEATWRRKLASSNGGGVVDVTDDEEEEDEQLIIERRRKEREKLLMVDLNALSILF